MVQFLKSLPWNEMFQIFAGVVAVLVGFLFSEWKLNHNRKRKLKAHWASLLTELEISRQKANTYLSDKIAAPLYRLPMEAFQTSFPVILAEDDIEEKELNSLINFFSVVQDLNRGLEMTAQLHIEGEKKESQTFHDVANRNILYAKKLCKADDEDSTYVEAKKVIERHLKK